MPKAETENTAPLSAMRDRGMTLVELLMVMAIMAILATISFAGMRTAIPGWRLNTASRMLRTDLLDAKTRAARDMREVRVRFVDSDNYVIEQGNARLASTAWAINNIRGQVNSRTLSEESNGISIVMAKTESPVIFRPNGTINPVNGNMDITLSNGKAERALEVSMSGRIRIR